MLRPLQVYPRVCGGTRQPGTVRHVDGGLSPRVRGNPARLMVARGWAWSIPACAGEPLGCTAAINKIKVYPRVCGGTSDQWAALCVIDGLSPRVRGNPCDRRLPRPSDRSIPACAGERGRAENERLTAGSIPACAGEPLYRNPDLVRSRVYPRVCGGTSRECGFGGGVGGLSPRVRGEPTTTKPA